MSKRMDERGMMQVETIDEPVEVGARFGARGMRPVWFLWQGNRCDITEITSTWCERDGAQVHYCFSVMSGAGWYELRFDSRALRWRLTSVALDG